MSVDLKVVENSIDRVRAAIADQRVSHGLLVEAQGSYDNAQQETQDGLKELRGILDNIG